MSKIITISNKALQQFRLILKQNKTKSIYLSLIGGGCNGFEYNLKPTNSNLLDGDEIEIFTENENLNYSKKNDVTLHICGKSVLYLLGTHIDWTDDIMGQAFKFNNPNAVSKCGCGTSFSPFDF